MVAVRTEDVTQYRLLLLLADVSVTVALTELLYREWGSLLAKNRA